MSIIHSLKRWEPNDKGNTLLMTTIILLILSMIVASMMLLCNMRFDLAVFKRNTSNTYYLAKSAVEKQVEAINKGLQLQIGYIINNDVVPYYTEQLVEMKSSIGYDRQQVELVIQEDIAHMIKGKVYDYLLESYGNNKMAYTIQSDRADSEAYTEVKIQLTNKDDSGKILENEQLMIIATATTKNKTEIYDKQRVEGLIAIEIPDKILNRIYEQYEWNEEIPDILKNGILCYSDLLVSHQGQLVVKGDTRVGGIPLVDKSIEGEKECCVETNEIGGIIALNGGKIHVYNSVYCTRNILATNGWQEKGYEEETEIQIDEDAIAYTIGIVDDFYEGGENQTPYNNSHQVKNAEIKIGRNAMVDNDVLISKWVNNCIIDVKETIFGVSAGGKNPNQSSGIFARGEQCKVKAGGMYVAGQPFVLCGVEQIPLRLWESIGEPFQDVVTWEGYQEGEEREQNRGYLQEDSPFYSMIATDRIETDFTNTYAIASVSGLDTSTGIEKIGAKCKNVFGENEIEACNFFFQGQQQRKYSIGEFMKETSKNEAYISLVDSIIQDEAEYYLNGSTSLSRRNLGKIRGYTYEGLKGYMTLMRSILYQSNEVNTANSYLKEASISEVINIEKLPKELHEWSYTEPIQVIGEQQKDGNEICNIEVSDFYINEGGGMKPYPTLIINANPGVKLKIEADEEMNTLKGWIISLGPVELGENIKIDGGMIVGGPEKVVENRKEIYEGKNAGIIVKEGRVEVSYNPDVFLEIQIKGYKGYRNLLDALYLTNYDEKSIEDIMNRQNVSTKAALKYSKQSTFEFDIEKVNVELQYIKTDIY